jgi:hypothetical protein
VKKFILFIITATLSFSAIAQDSSGTRTARDERREEKRQRINSVIRQEEEGVLSYTKQSVLGVELRTNGYGAFYELGRRRSPRFTNLYTIGITEIKHPKEEKSGSATFFGNTFIFGKINNFYQVKLGFGQQYIFGQKGNKNGVAVTGSLQGGLSLGLLKPYYLDVEDSAGRNVSVKYSPETSIYYRDGASIIRSSGVFKGWGDVKVKPGGYLKTALRFDFGRYNESVQALEIGMSLEAYTQKVPILLLNDPQQLFYQGHIAFVFGRRK